MKLHCFTVTKAKPIFSMAIDPGINSTGFTLLDTQKRSVTHAMRESELKIMKVPTPLLVPKVIQSVSESIQIVKDCFHENPKEIVQTEVIIEDTFLAGKFSPGLVSFITLLVHQLVFQCVPARIVFVPSNAISWFLNGKANQKKPTDKTVKEFCVRSFPHLRGVPQPIHVCDSLLLSYICHAKFYRKVYGVNIDVPFDIELVDVLDSLQKEREECRSKKKEKSLKRLKKQKETRNLKAKKKKKK